AIAVMADRAVKDGDRLAFPGLIDKLATVSRDEDPLIRQTCAFALGLFSEEDARSRLEVMVADSDPDTRINAAIALSRDGDVHGAGVFREVLKGAADQKEPGSDAEFEQFLALKNCIAAIERVSGAFNAPERQELATLLEPIAGDFREPGIRIAARNALSTLRAER